MNVLLSLVLLLCVRRGCSEVSVHQEDIKKFSDHDEMKADVPPELHSFWGELLGLKEQVLSLKAAEVGQRQAQRSMESQLRDWQEDAEQQRRRLDQLEDTLLHRAVEPLMEPGSSLRRRVENLEVQSEGGCSSGSSSGAEEPSEGLFMVVLNFNSHLFHSFGYNEVLVSSSNFCCCSVSARAAEVSTLKSRMNSSESSFEEHVKTSSGEPLSSQLLHTCQRHVRISNKASEGTQNKPNWPRRKEACSSESTFMLGPSVLRSRSDSADLVTRATTHSKPAFPDLL